jgi:hypothetical protein
MSMRESTMNVSSLHELRRYIAETLGRLESLQAEHFQLTQHVLYRGGKACGIYFCLQGARALRLTAIWETDQNSVLFYSSCGVRVHRTKLTICST